MELVVYNFNSMAAICILLSACGAPDFNKVNDINEVRSLGAAFRQMQNIGIAVSAEPKSLGKAKASSFNSSFFGLGATTAVSTITVQLDVTLGESPAALRIKQEGVSVYTYILPRYEVTRKRPNNKTYNRKERLLLNNGVGSLCYGYYVILSPQNNYSRSWLVSNKIQVRKETTGMNAGIWGSNLGASIWEISDISPQNKSIATVRNGPFRYNNPSRLLNNCWADQETRNQMKQ